MEAPLSIITHKLCCARMSCVRAWSDKDMSGDSQSVGVEVFGN